MKKILLILIPSILLLVIVIFLILVRPFKEETFYLDDEYYGNNSLIEIDSNELKTLEESKKSFIVFIYQPFCSTPHSFSDNIVEFLDTYQISFHKILFSEIKDTSITNYIKYCPSVVIYHKGKIVAYLDPNSNKDIPYYESVEGFKKWFTKYVLLK